MNVQSIFIIDKKNNMLVFLDILDSSISINQQDLVELLGLIVSNVASIEINSIKKQVIKGQNYTLGNFEKVIIILRHEQADPIPDNLLKTLNKSFNFKFSKILGSYTESDIPKFKAFKTTADDIIKKFQTAGEDITEEEIEIPEKKPSLASEAQPEIKMPEPIKEADIGSKPLINPIKREAYPNGIPDYNAFC